MQLAVTDCDSVWPVCRQLRGPIDTLSVTSVYRRRLYAMITTGRIRTLSRRTLTIARPAQPDNVRPSLVARFYAKRERESSKTFEYKALSHCESHPKF